jgi:uncharacterized membrane protein (DUF106 family)
MVIECGLNFVQEYLDEVKQDMREANNQYRAVLKKREDDKIKQMEKTADMLRATDDLKRSLHFD